MPVNRDAIQKAARMILEAVGEDPAREGLRDTPRRYADLWAEFIDYEPGRLGTSFATVESDQMVVVSGMQVWSLCEHHLLPFRCQVAVGYIPDRRLLGLSKFGRVVCQAAHRLQLQERLTAEIAAKIRDLAETENVAVFAQGEHLCMSMRGVQIPAAMKTSVMWGLFRSDEKARAEFLRLVRT